MNDTVKQKKGTLKKNNSSAPLNGTRLLTEVKKISKSPSEIKREVISIVPQEVAQKHRMVVFERDGNHIKAAMEDSKSIDALNVLRFVAEKEKVEVEIYEADAKIVDEMLQFYAGTTDFVQQAVKSFEGDISIEDDSGKEQEDIKKEEMLKDAPVTKLVQVILSHAIDGKASDVHIEPMDHDYRVRFRVDGVLHLSLILPKEIGPVVVSRIKILSSLKIDEKRKPQDGRFGLTMSGKAIDFRVSTLPVINGEKVVMRILDNEGGVSKIESLGLVGSAREHMEMAIQETYGMILVTGPTGSGKSTTLYALLKILNNEERNIITLEDPIEYNIEGLNQSQIKPEIGYTFASGLRTILRQDPNVIMVGEIRDAETAELAVHAALTGHLMFSTLHTNTAVGAIPRLVDMGIEPFLIASSLRLVVAQRLVRRICEECKEEIETPPRIKDAIMSEIKNISQEELKRYNLDFNQGLNFYHGKGCEACGNKGLRGRVAIYEVIPASEDVKTIIVEKRGNEGLLKEARDSMGIITIKQDGILKALAGYTTLEEIERVIEGKFGLTEED